MDDSDTKKLNSDRVSSDAARCLICLNTFSGQTVANPQPCGHLYCLTCITEWAKTSNSCPVDRLEFHAVCQRSDAGSKVQKIVKVEVSQDKGLEEDDANELSVCEECGRSDRRHLMLLCATCETRYHIDCLSPPLSTVPFDDWFCQDCVVDGSRTNDSSREETDIDDDELMDLVAEVVPTSSRLRVSTTTRPGVCANTRRSERIRHLSRRRDPSRPQTAQDVPKYLLKSFGSDEEDGKTESPLLNLHQSGKAANKRKRR